MWLLETKVPDAEPVTLAKQFDAAALFRVGVNYGIDRRHELDLDWRS